MSTSRPPRAKLTISNEMCPRSTPQNYELTRRSAASLCRVPKCTLCSSHQSGTSWTRFCISLELVPARARELHRKIMTRAAHPGCLRCDMPAVHAAKSRASSSSCCVALSSSERCGAAHCAESIEVLRLARGAVHRFETSLAASSCTGAWSSSSTSTN